MPPSVDQDLRTAFAEWMRSRLGYHQVDARAVLTGKAAERHAVSIHGQVYGSFFRFLNMMGVAALLVVVVIENAPVQTADGAPPSLLANGFGVLAIGAFATAYVGKKRTARHAWGECRDLDRAMRRRDVETFNAAVSDVRANEAAEWKPRDVLLVSGTVGFEPEALEEAKRLGIECYRRTADGFEHVAGG